jgi:hypothetical protein
MPRQITQPKVLSPNFIAINVMTNWEQNIVTNIFMLIAILGNSLL